MFEDKTGQPAERGKSLSPERQIDNLLRSKNPVSDLKRICSEIPHFLSLQESLSLREKRQDVELVYRCLPVLKSAIDHYGYFDFDEKELFEVGFFTMQGGIAHWGPEKESSGKNEPLKQFVSNEIRRAMEDAITEAYGLGGVHNFPVVDFYRHCWLDFIRENNCEPNLEEIEDFSRLRNEKNLSLEVGIGKGRKVSLIRLIYEATGGFLKPGVEEDNVLRPIEKEALGKGGLTGDIYQAMKVLTPLEKTILRLRYFVSAIDKEEKDEVASLEKIAGYFGVTREKIRQIEAKALRKLRHPSVSRKLRDYLIS